MPRAPDWTEDEFQIVLDNENASIAELSELLPKRSEDAIQLVRNGIVSWHRGQETSMLSKMMIAALEARNRSS